MGVVGLRGRSWQALLVGCGVAISVALLVGILGGSLLAQNRALQGALAALPPQERALRVDIFGLPVQQPFRADDRAASSALASLGSRDPLRVSFFHDALVDGQLVRLVAIDGLSHHVTLRRGRLPRSCTAQACEVLQVGARGRSMLREGEISLVRTGMGQVVDPGDLGPAFQGLHTYGTQEGVRSPVVLVTSSTAAVERVPGLELLFRVRSWIAPSSSFSVRSWEVDDLLARESRAQNALHEVDGAFKLDAPDDALLAARERGTVSARRMVLLGASASALLLGFVFVAALGLRRAFASQRRRLLQHGAMRWQVRTAAAVEVAVITLLATAFGVLVGAFAIALVASAVDQPPVATLGHALLGGPALLGIALAWLLATGLVLAAAASGEDEPSRGRVRLLDVAALGAVVAVVVGLRHQSLAPEDLASGASPTILVALPLLVCFAGGVAAARLLGPLMRAMEKLSRRGPLPLGLALTGLARAPARTAAAGAFLAVAVGLAVFASTYRGTLAQSARDEVGYRVPLEAVVQQGRRPLLSFGAASPVAASPNAHLVLRRPADAAALGTSAQGVTVLGVPGAALRTMYWRKDFSPTSRSRLAERVTADGLASLRGTPLPGGATRLSATVRVRGEPVQLGLELADPAGVVRTVPLGRAGRGESTLTERLPRAAGRARVTGLELSLTRNGTNWLYHLDQEGRLIRPPDGTLTVSSLRAVRSDGSNAGTIDSSPWIVHTRGGRVVGRRPLRIAYTFDEAQTIVARPRQPTDGHALRVVASPDVAAVAGTGGTIVLDFGGVSVTARVVGVAGRFPTLAEGEPFVVADASRLRTMLDADAPESGTPDEAWLASAGRFAVPGATVVVRDNLLAGLERDPLARAIGYVLGVSALLALALAAVGVWLTLVSGLHDERRDLVDLEAQGATPAVLQAYLRIRSLILLGFGLAAGVALGLVLARLVVSLVRVSAETTVAQPPLVLAPDWLPIAAVLGGFVLAVVLALEATLRTAFRKATPARDLWSLE